MTGVQNSANISEQRPWGHASRRPLVQLRNSVDVFVLVCAPGASPHLILLCPQPSKYL